MYAHYFSLNSSSHSPLLLKYVIKYPTDTADETIQMTSVVTAAPTAPINWIRNQLLTIFNTPSTTPIQKLTWSFRWVTRRFPVVFRNVAEKN